MANKYQCFKIYDYINQYVFIQVDIFDIFYVKSKVEDVEFIFELPTILDVFCFIFLYKVSLLE